MKRSHCKTWQESEEGVRDFMQSATENEARDALYEVRGMARRYAGVSRVTAERLEWIADVVEKLGEEKFGLYFDVPF
ncbi:hypothetical protein [Aromatoleum aromaticum]|uniref:hypothetical protein n=1 Tax=Aromatoleum aromaticum TaxID=551760 RepID=UPI00030D849D|nr:hypothetical protein [Aromatoleum aromaticum]